MKVWQSSGMSQSQSEFEKCRGASYRGVQGCFEYDLRALEIPYLFYFGLETLLAARSRYGYLKSKSLPCF